MEYLKKKGRKQKKEKRGGKIEMMDVFYWTYVLTRQLRRGASQDTKQQTQREMETATQQPLN